MTTVQGMSIRSLQRRILREATVVDVAECPINLAIDADRRPVLLIGPVTFALPLDTADAGALSDGIRTVLEQIAEAAADGSHPAASGPESLI